MKILKRILFTVLVTLILILLVPTAAAGQDEVPQLPALYWGNITAICTSGNISIPVTVPAGITITTSAGGSITVTGTGTYGGPSGLDPKLTVQGDILQGSPIQFYVGGLKAEEIASFRNNSPQQIDLTIYFVQGDATADDTVNALDITKVERIIAGMDPLMFSGDATLDGKINAIDITKVERIIAGLD